MAEGTGQEFELNLQDYFNIFLKRKWLILLAFLAVFSLMFIYTNLQTPLYRASVLFKIELTQRLLSDVVFPRPDMYFVGTGLHDYAEQLVSYPVIETAAKELGWITDGMSDGEKGGVVGSIRGRIKANELQKTHMIRLGATFEDPVRAAAIANKIFDVFKRKNIELKNQKIHSVRVFVEDALNKIADKLEKQEDRLRELTMEGALGTGTRLIDVISGLERRRSDLLTRFTERHPEIISIDEEIAQYKEKLRALPKEEFEYSFLKRDIFINENLYNQLRQKLQETKIKEAEKIDNVILINPAGVPKVPCYPNKRRNYMLGMMLGFICGVILAFGAEQLDTSIRKIEDLENFLKVSVLGTIPYCAKEDMARRQKAGRIQGLFLRRGKTKTKDVAAKSFLSMALGGDYDHVFLEAFRILTVNMQMRFGKGGKIKNKVVMITSCNPRDGKTVITCNLGFIMAQMGNKVLVIDTDLRRSSVHKAFGLQKKGAGLTDILVGDVDPDSATKTATDLMLEVASTDKIMDNPWLNNLNVITAGSMFQDPAHLFSSDKLNELLGHFKNKYDIVLLDTSPILAVSEPSILASRADEVLLIFRAGLTSRYGLRMAKNQIESAKGKGGLSGIVINSIKPESGKYGYYYGRYGHYYADEKEGKEKA